MQDIDHNMDELLRKAADNYPLKMDDGNWDAVAAQLNTAPVSAPKKNRSRKYWLPILFLLLILFTADIIFKPGADTGKRSAYRSSSNLQREITPEKDQPATSHTPFQLIKSRQRNIFITQQQSTTTDVAITYINNATASGTINIPGIQLFKENVTGVAFFTDNLVASKSSVETIHSNQLPLIDSIARSTSTSNPRKPRAKIYIGLATGPEFNQVKNQGLQKTGFDAGFIAGYQHNRKLSVETGLFLSKKYYFSDGKYFNMDMPGMKVVSLEGSCTVLEIPLKLKYGIVTRNKMTLFSSAGISSYMMINEKNNYLLRQLNGTQQSMIASYDERCRYFAATVDLSIGCQHTLGKSTNLRIEPYLQLPLKGIGVGTIPVKSAGMHIGVIRSIF
jgi:hypothetical protein